MSSESDRVIPATPRRREEARRRGMMPTAALPAWVASAATAVLLLPAWGAATMPAATDLVRSAVAGAGQPRPPSLWPQVVAVAIPTGGVVLAAAAAGIAIRLMFDGVSWIPARAMPAWSRIDPLAGVSRIVSLRTLRSMIGGAAGLAVMLTAAWWSLRPLMAISSATGEADAASLVGAAWWAAAWLSVAAAAVAVVRWLTLRRRFERQIRMTPQEFADETRSAESNPKVRLLRQRQPRQTTAGGA